MACFLTIPASVPQPSVYFLGDPKLKLSEVFLFVRPEEKPAVERALTCVIGPRYNSMAALGRGSKGGVEYGRAGGSPIARFFKRPALASFLPKTAYYFVVADADVDYILDAVQGTLASEGGPDDCGRGLAIVCPLETQFSIEEIVQGKTSALQDRDAAIPTEEAPSL